MSINFTIIYKSYFLYYYYIINITENNKYYLKFIVDHEK